MNFKWNYKNGRSENYIVSHIIESDSITGALGCYRPVHRGKIKAQSFNKADDSFIWKFSTTTLYGNFIWSDTGKFHMHYNDVKMGAMASQITGVSVVYSTVYSGSDQRKHQSPASLAFVRGIHRWPVNSPHKGPGTREKFPFDDVIMNEPPAQSCKAYCLVTPRDIASI